MNLPLSLILISILYIAVLSYNKLRCHYLLKLKPTFKHVILRSTDSKTSTSNENNEIEVS